MTATRHNPKNAILAILRRTRLFRADEIATLYEQLRRMSPEAVRKTCERMLEAGDILASATPKGKRVFRLSGELVGPLGVTRCYAASPSAAVMVESIAAFALAHEIARFAFLTKQEVEEIFRKRGHTKAKAPNNRFLLRKTEGRVIRLDVFIAEALAADALVKRLVAVTTKLRQHPAIAEIDAAGLFGATVAVPTDGLKEAIQSRGMPELPIDMVVVEVMREMITRAS
jgi:hypothetical protein